MTMTGMKGYGSRQITVTDSVVIDIAAFAFTDSQLRVADGLHIQAKDGTVSYWYDGTDPEPDEGFILFQGQGTIITTNYNVRNFKVIAETTDVVLAVSLCTFAVVPV